MKIKKAIIPAAGRGTRFLPLTKSQPKEMLPIVDKPCIQYLVEEAVASGIEEIIIITARGKRSIEDYFDQSFELQYHLRKKGEKNLLKKIEKIEKMAKFYYVRQDYPKGDGHAILCAKELVKEEPFAVLFGDDIYDSSVPALSQLINKYEELKTPVIALEKIPKTETHKYGIVKTNKISDKTHNIKGLIEKPSPSRAPSNLAITGKYIITPELLQTLSKTKTGQGSELRLINGMQNYIKGHSIHGLIIDGQRFDTGDKLGYLKAVIHFSLKHKNLQKEVKKFLQSLDLN
ncbi:UTP--glucose-1-phosphate uridylyltransferase GalU [Candidatus Peregrinibacteria bacterium]|nr:UTP--glucose-1-phosphate uridylyltransferase GalU [Candidatus Peregrinibacteria bacterium]